MGRHIKGTLMDIVLWLWMGGKPITGLLEDVLKGHCSPEGREACPWRGAPPPNPILKTAVFFHFCFPVHILFVFQCGSVLSHSVMSDSFVIPWIVAHQVPLFMGFSRQEYWSGLPGPPPDSGIYPHFLSLLHWQASSLPLEPPEKPSPHTLIHNQKLRRFH